MSYRGELHTHHIKEQQTANKNGLIDHFHKNTLGNLVILCDKHHNEVHNGNLIIEGWNDTEKGKILDYRYESKKNIKKRKFNNQQIEIVNNMKDKSINARQCRKILEDSPDFKIISEETIKKIWKGTY